MRTVTKHYIDGELVESRGREVMESVNPIGREFGVYGIEAYLEPRALFPLASGR